MKRQAGSLFAVLAVWASMMSTAEAQTRPVLCAGIVATIVGTPGDDVLEGTDGPDVIAGLQGDDWIDGFAGDDVLCGGVGDDFIIGGLDFDLIFGAQGNDEIYAGGHSSLFVPGSLDDVRGARIFAGAGDDIVFGSNRWDRMQGGPGNDVLYGFGGNDWMRGGPGRDHIVGHNGKDDIQGGSGADTILAERKDTRVRAGGGNDWCANVPGTSDWRGCTNRIGVDPTDSTLPPLQIPEEIDGGPSAFYVYAGYQSDSDVPVFVGITDDFELTVLDERLTGISEVSVVPLTFGQALAVEQAVLEIDDTLINEFNALNPSAPYFDDAVAWGLAWLELNGYG